MSTKSFGSQDMASTLARQCLIDSLKQESDRFKYLSGEEIVQYVPLSTNELRIEAENMAMASIEDFRHLVLVALNNIQVSIDCKVEHNLKTDIKFL